MREILRKVLIACSLALAWSGAALAQAPPVTTSPQGWLQYGPSVSLSVSTASARVLLGWTGKTAPPSAWVCNVGSAAASVRAGNSSVVALVTDFSIPAGSTTTPSCSLMTLNGAPYIAAITGASTTTLLIYSGSGNPLGSGAAGGSGGGGGGGTGTPGGATNSAQYNAGGGNFGGVTMGDATLLLGQTGSFPAAYVMSGDATMTDGGAITVTKTNGVAFGTLATLNAAPAGTLTGTTLNSTVITSSLTSVGALASGSLASGFTVVSPALGGTGEANNSANTLTFSGNYGLTLTLTNTTSVTLPTSGTLITGITGCTATTHQWIDALSSAGVCTKTQPATTDLSDIGTFSINTTGGITASGTSTSGTIAGSICATSAGLYLYEAGVNCYVASSPAFSSITSGTNTAAAMVVGAGATFAIASTGTLAISNTALPTPAAGKIGISGAATDPTLAANGEGAIYQRTTTDGIAIMGRGGACDVTLLDYNAGKALCVTTGTANIALGGKLSMSAELTIGGVGSNTTIESLTGGSHLSADATSDFVYGTSLNTSGNPVVWQLAITDTAAGATSLAWQILGGTTATTSEAKIDLTGNMTLAGGITAPGASTFAETHGTTYAPTLTSNNYTAATTDCGKTLLLPTGTTPTLTLPNLNASCTIVVIQNSATQYTVQAASGGTLVSVNSYTKTKAQNAILFLTIIVPSASAATWDLAGDGA